MGLSVTHVKRVITCCALAVKICWSTASLTVIKEQSECIYKSVENAAISFTVCVFVFSSQTKMLWEAVCWCVSACGRSVLKKFLLTVSDSFHPKLCRLYSQIAIQAFYLGESKTLYANNASHAASNLMMCSKLGLCSLCLTESVYPEPGCIISHGKLIPIMQHSLQL